MRAPSKRTSAKEKREADESRANETETTDTVTRVSPLRVSTLDLNCTDTSMLPSDFGTMSRHEGDPVPHEHQFYRTTLKGLLSLDLHSGRNILLPEKRRVIETLTMYGLNWRQAQGTSNISKMKNPIGFHTGRVFNASVHSWMGWHISKVAQSNRYITQM